MPGASGRVVAAFAGDCAIDVRVAAATPAAAADLRKLRRSIRLPPLWFEGLDASGEGGDGLVHRPARYCGDDESCHEDGMPGV